MVVSIFSQRFTKQSATCFLLELKCSLQGSERTCTVFFSFGLAPCFSLSDLFRVFLSYLLKLQPNVFHYFFSDKCAFTLFFFTFHSKLCNRDTSERECGKSIICSLPREIEAVHSSNDNNLKVARITLHISMPCMQPQRCCESSVTRECRREYLMIRFCMGKSITLK